MNLKATSICILLCAVLFSTSTNAQHDHSSHGKDQSHQNNIIHPPHGGEIIEAGKYKIEVVVDMLVKHDQITFYLFKGNLKPVSNEEITGTITLKLKDGSVITNKIQAKGDSRFVTQLKNTESFSGNVELLVKGKTISADFYHAGLENQMTSVYSCSMHPHVKSDNPGKCPKCGMNLEKQ